MTMFIKALLAASFVVDDEVCVTSSSMLSLALIPSYMRCCFGDSAHQTVSSI